MEKHSERNSLTTKKSRTLPGVSFASSNYFVAILFNSPWAVVNEAFVCRTACLDRIEYLACDATSEMPNLLLQLRWRTKSNCSYHKHRRPCSWEELRVVNCTFWIDKHFVNNRLLSSQVHVEPWSAALIFDEHNGATCANCWVQKYINKLRYSSLDAFWHDIVWMVASETVRTSFEIDCIDCTSQSASVGDRCCEFEKSPLEGAFPVSRQCLPCPWLERPWKELTGQV